MPYIKNIASYITPPALIDHGSLRVLIAALEGSTDESIQDWVTEARECLEDDETLVSLTEAGRRDIAPDWRDIEAS